MKNPDTLKVYVLGRISAGSELLVLGEYQGYRAVHRRTLAAAEIDKFEKLSSAITQLRVFAEAGAPPFGRRNLEELGANLFDLIVNQKVRRVFDRAASGNRGAGDLLPLEIVVEDHVLAGWPWEYLYDTDANSFLCQEFHPIVRGIFTIVPRRALKAIDGKIRLGILLGVRSDDPNTTPDEEVRWIQRVFETDLATDAVEIDVVRGLSAAVELERFLSQRQFHILHFFGHARFDDVAQEGYLRFDVAGQDGFRLSARIFAGMVSQHQKDVRLVFLNACESGRTSVEVDPARSAIAASLLELGVPAVIATQFSMPDVSAHFLSAMIYNRLATGKALVDAMVVGRRAMQLANDSQFFDWGIPVLYASNPWMPVFPEAIQSSGLKEFSKNLDAPNTLLNTLAASEGTAPSFKVQPAKSAAKATRRAALVDLDVKAGFLPELVQRANAAQSYFSFEVAYVPLPMGCVMTRIGEESVDPQLFVPRVESHLKDVTSSLKVDRACCITACLVAWQDKKGEIRYNYFASPLNSNPNVSIVSATDLREYAATAGAEYSKALLLLCLGQLVIAEPSAKVGYHDETRGCLFDFCENRADVVEGLRKMKFDHVSCRKRIGNQRLLDAIDALVGL